MTWQITSGPAAEPVSLTAAKLHCRIDGSSEDTLLNALLKAARQFCEGFQGRSYVTRTIRLTLDKFPGKFTVPRPPLQSVTSIKYIDIAGVQQTLDNSVYDVDAESEPGRIALAYGQSWPGIRGDINSIEVVYTAGYASKFTADASSDILTVSGRTYTNADIVRLSNSGGALPAPLAALTEYHIRDVSGSTLKLAASAGGAAIDITDAGTGTHFLGEIPANAIAAMKLLVGHLYENRETTSPLTIKEVPMAVKSLLMIDGVQLV